MHRPSNVDEPVVLKKLPGLFLEFSGEIPVVLPVHPRTRPATEVAGFLDLLAPCNGWTVTAPFSYHGDLNLMAEARVVITDSGGMQEEANFQKVPGLRLHWNTERPITFEKGTSRLVGNDPERIRTAFNDVLSVKWAAGEDNPLWDGQAGQRIANTISENINPDTARILL